jgi:nucleoside-diphosphate-sugar epimerase
MGHRVSVLGRRRYPELSDSIIQLQVDLRDSEAVSNACYEQESVFHAGALAGIWGKRCDYFQTNVEGTHNVIKGCLEHGVRKLVFTSSPSVVFNQNDMKNVDESVPYPSHYLSDYPKTKALAEQSVVAANGQQSLLTVSLRPHLIWGPGDPHLVPRIIERAKRGQLVRVGEGTNRVDTTYIENAVEGHIKAWQALETGSPVAGQCYFLSDGEPVVLWDWINQLLVSLGISPVTKSISYSMARKLGWVLEGVYRIFGFSGEPRMTRFLAGQLATSHYFDISRARRDLNYEVRVSPEEGMKRLLKSLQVPLEG